MPARPDMSDPNPELGPVISRVVAGDEAAARQLLDTLYPLVYRLVRSHLPRRSSEEDLVQMSFLKIFSRLHQYSGKVPIEHWVSRVTINTCLNALERERVRPELRWADLSEEEEAVLRQLSATENEIVPGYELGARELVDHLLSRLEPHDRLLVTLVYLEGRSVSEVSHTVGRTRTSVKVRLFRARKRLKRHLELLMADRPGTRPLLEQTASALARAFIV